ncbi:MAG: hypothetical protein RLY14_2077, partial [Planctomycetota bacterium]
MLWNTEADQAWFELMRANSMSGGCASELICGATVRLTLAGLAGQLPGQFIVASWGGDEDDADDDVGDDLDGTDDGS